jgi:hypothetical protein
MDITTNISYVQMAWGQVLHFCTISNFKDLPRGFQVGCKVQLCRQAAAIV